MSAIFAELRSYEEDAVVRRIEAHVARETRRLDRLRHVILVGRILVDDGQGAVGVGGKGITRGRVVARAIDTLANRDRRNNFASLVIGNCHYAAAAPGEQTMVRGIDGHRDRILARCGGPAPRDRGFGGVDLDDLGGVGEIGIDFTIAGRRAVFRLASQRNIGDELARVGVDGGGGVGVAVKGKTRFEAAGRSFCVVFVG